jgi:uncharacterized protein (TIGR03118 family)
MKSRSGRVWTWSAVLAVSATFASFGIAKAGPPATNAYVVRNLVSDGTIPAENPPDPNLVNAWGIAHSATSPWWVADNETAVSTLYNGAGAAQSLIVKVPGAPTGMVFNGSSSFVVTDGVTSGAARFLFASEDGTISGWNPNVPGPGSTQAFVGATSPDDGNYKGLAIASTASGNFLYAADFHNARVDVWNGGFQLVTMPGAFVDPSIPSGFAPFGIQNLQGRIYVAYAKQDDEAEDEVAGPGLGYVSVFDTAGTFLARVASRDALDAPWGMAIAPAGFGRFSGNLLVGNFGDGRINAYDPNTFEARGHLKLPNHKPVVIDGLWGIGFGNDANAGPTTTLFFAAGPADETQGLFGSITAQP